MIRFLVYLVVGFCSTFSFLYLFYNLVDCKSKINFKIILVYVLGSISVTLIEYFDIFILSSIFYFIYFPFLFFLLKKMSIRKTIFYLIAVWLYGIVIDLILLLILSIVFYLFGLNIYLDYNNATSVVLSILVAIILCFLAKIPFIKNFTSKLCSKMMSIDYSTITLVIFSLFVLLIAILMLLNIKNLSVSFMLILLAISILIDFIVLIKYKIKEIENYKFLNTLKENNDFYIKLDDENRIFRHNLNAKLMSIKSVSNKKSAALIDDLLVTYNKNINFSNGIKSIPFGLDGIIYQKVYPYLKKLNVKFDNFIDKDIFDFLKPRRYNVLVEKLVVSLDNAIESSLKSKEKILYINIYEENNIIVIVIENTFSGSVEIDYIGNKNYSTKGTFRGLGLFSILRNNEASLSVKIQNDIFITKIVAKKQVLEN